MTVNDTEELGIAQVGLGGITVHHRAGYRDYGQPLVGGYDPDPGAVARFRADSPDAVAFGSLSELLSHPRVGVIDLATPHYRETRHPVMEQIAAAGKPVLIQKPLAYTYAEAEELAGIVERSGIPAMVNQNMCFTPGSLLLVDALMKDHVVGEPFFAQLTIQYRFDTDHHPWFGRDTRWWTGALTVHHLGLLQLLFGPPENVFAVTGKDPSQPGVPHDGYGHMLLRYPGGMAVSVTSTGTYYGTRPVPHRDEQLWVQGPDGIVDWTPQGALDVSRRSAERGIIDRLPSQAADGTWFPNAFGLTMAHFRQAVQEGAEPLCSVRDNLYVMAVVEAAYRSSDENRLVPLSEIMGDRYDPSYGPGWSHGFGLWRPPARTAGNA